jgi:hypothetical protein
MIELDTTKQTKNTYKRSQLFLEKGLVLSKEEEEAVQSVMDSTPRNRQDVVVFRCTGNGGVMMYFCDAPRKATPLVSLSENAAPFISPFTYVERYTAGKKVIA